jgi:hypothetical protein
MLQFDIITLKKGYKMFKYYWKEFLNNFREALKIAF